MLIVKLNYQPQSRDTSCVKKRNIRPVRHLQRNYTQLIKVTGSQLGQDLVLPAMGIHVGKCSVGEKMALTVAGLEFVEVAQSPDLLSH